MKRTILLILCVILSVCAVLIFRKVFIEADKDDDDFIQEKYAPSPKSINIPDCDKVHYDVTCNSKESYQEVSNVVHHP